MNGNTITISEELLRRIIRQEIAEANLTEIPALEQRIRALIRTEVAESSQTVTLESTESSSMSDMSDIEHRLSQIVTNTEGIGRTLERIVGELSDLSVAVQGND